MMRYTHEKSDFGLISGSPDINEPARGYITNSHTHRAAQDGAHTLTNT